MAYSDSASLAAENLSDLFIKVINRFGELDKLPFIAGDGEMLHTSEIHAMDIIGFNKNINITHLANLLGLTKGAVSIMMGKLVKKSYVIKNISPETDNEVVLKLTEKGGEVFDWHQQHRCRLKQKIEELITEAPQANEYYTKLCIELDKVFVDLIEERKT